MVNLSSKFAKLVKYLEEAMSYHPSHNAVEKHFCDRLHQEPDGDLLQSKFEILSDSKTCKIYSPNDASLATVTYFNISL